MMRAGKVKADAGRASRCFASRSAEETERLGKRLAAELPVPGVALLCGALGSGKTTLARGLASGLGLRDTASVHSPSFTLVNVYQGRCPIYHVDLYRLSGDREMSSIGLDDFLGRDGVTIVEWGERLGFECEAALLVDIEVLADDSRNLRVRVRGPRPQRSHRKRELPF